MVGTSIAMEMALAANNLNITPGMTVSVDRDFARFGGKSYAINKINSVEVRSRRPYSKGAWIVLSILCALFAMATLGQLAGGDGGSATVALVITGGLGWFAYRAYRQSKIVEYSLILMTSSSEAEAITSLDGPLIQELRRKIEAAMTGRL